MSGHNRYLIYRMLGRKVSFNSCVSRRARRLSGVVERVCRNVFDNKVELTVDGQTHSFDEPAAIVTDGRASILFLYGNPGDDDMSDNALFAEMRDSVNVGEPVDEVIRRTARVENKSMRFSVGERMLKPGRAFRKRRSSSCSQEAVAVA